MRTLLVLGGDVVAILLLVSIYYRRHRRGDMLLAFIGLNIGVLIVATVLTSVSVGLGVGLGLFGVLSIIRLRSSEITQEEVAYYFASLALGLVSGLRPDPAWLAPTLCALLVVTIAIADHPKFHESSRRQRITLDAVYPSERQLHEALATLLQADLKRAVVLETDLVRDQTLVDVSYLLRADSAESGVPDVAWQSAAHSLPSDLGAPQSDVGHRTGMVQSPPVPRPPVEAGTASSRRQA